MFLKFKNNLERLGRLFRKIKSELLPSEHDRIFKEWKRQGGDYHFRFNYNLSSDSVIMDLGGFEGQWASDIFSRYACNILIFEPSTSFAKNISERFKNNQKITIFPFGLGSRTRTERLYLCQDGSSIFKGSGSFEEIKILDALEWFSENKFDKIDLMKINIEGGEYELLERLIETNLIEKIQNIQIQFHRVHSTSEAKMNEIQRYLSRTHEQTYNFKFLWENWKLK